MGLLFPLWLPDRLACTSDSFKLTLGLVGLCFGGPVNFALGLQCHHFDGDHRAMHVRLPGFGSGVPYLDWVRHVCLALNSIVVLKYIPMLALAKM